MTKQAKLLIAKVAVAVAFIIGICIDWQLTRGTGSPAELLQAVALGPRVGMQVMYGALMAIFIAVWVIDSAPPEGETRPTNYGLWCLGGAAVGVFVSAAFARTAPSEGAHWSGGYWLHLLGGGAATVLVPVAMFMFAGRFKTVDHDASRWTWTLVAAISATGVGLALVLFPPHALAGPTPLMAFVARHAHFLILAVWGVAVSVRGPGTKKAETKQPQQAEGEPKPSSEAVAPILEAIRTAVAAKEDRFDWEKFAAKIEVLTLPLVLIGGVIALLEYSDGHKRDVREVSKGAYAEADSNWTEFVKLCAEHPETGCYDGAPDVGSDPAHSGPVFSLAIDSFETAYRNYNDREYITDAVERYCDEWPTWVLAMRRYARRPSFDRVWQYAGSEYGMAFQRCMNALIKEQAGKPFDETATLATEPPEPCRLDVCDASAWIRGAAQ